MSPLLSSKYSAGAVNTALFLLRIVIGILMLRHGYDKILKFEALHLNFPYILGIGSTISLILVIFAEFFCSILLIMGLFTRLACIPLIISISVALFKIHNANFFGKGEVDTLYLICFIVILLIGPGRVSIDNMIGK